MIVFALVYYRTIGTKVNNNATVTACFEINPIAKKVATFVVVIQNLGRNTFASCYLRRGYRDIAVSPVTRRVVICIVIDGVIAKL